MLEGIGEKIHVKNSCDSNREGFPVRQGLIEESLEVRKLDSGGGWSARKLTILVYQGKRGHRLLQVQADFFSGGFLDVPAI